MQEINELSERELEILSLVATGANNKEIARQLYISTNTVKVHLRNIFTKIGAASRTEAAMYAVSNGLVPGVLPADVTAPAGSLDVAEPVRQRRAVWGMIVLAVVLVGILAIVATVFLRQSAGQAAATSPVVTTSPRWKTLASMPTARSGFALASYENKIYAIAGDLVQGVSPVVERYDPEANAWEPLTPKPTAVGDVSAAVIGGKIYVPGGRLNSGAVTDVLEIFDPRQDTWEQGAPLPVALSAYALAAFEGKLYLFGGWDGQHYQDAVYEYDPEQDQWNRKSSMPEVRGYASAIVASGKIYIIGGYDGKKALTANQVYFPERDTGNDNPWEEATPLPEGRYAMGASGVADIVYVIGGIGSSGREMSSLVYYSQSNEWQLFDAPQVKVGSGLGLVSQGSYLFAIGGKTDEVPNGDNYAYQAIYTISIPVIVK